MFLNSSFQLTINGSLFFTIHGAIYHDYFLHCQYHRNSDEPCTTLKWTDIYFFSRSSNSCRAEPSEAKALHCISENSLNKMWMSYSLTCRA